MAIVTCLLRTGYEMGFSPHPEYVAPHGAWNACRLGDYKDFAPDGATGTHITYCYSMSYAVIKRRWVVIRRCQADSVRGCQISQANKWRSGGEAGMEGGRSGFTETQRPHLGGLPH